MYDLLDQPVAKLTPGGRFILWAMRGWIRAASSGICPPGALAPAFARHGVLTSLPHFHVLLAELNGRANRKISFSPLAHPRVGDDEAVLLQICRDAQAQPCRARATIELLVENEAVSGAFTALLTFMALLHKSDLDGIQLMREPAPGSL